MKKSVGVQIVENMILNKEKDIERNKNSKLEFNNSSREEMLRMYIKWCKENERGMGKNENL